MPNDWLCDKTDDCGDLSDENSKMCDKSSHRTSFSINSTNDCDGYLCKNKECIPLGRVCDKKLDCTDGTDEGGFCGNSEIYYLIKN